MGTIYILAKYSVILLLLTNVRIHCETQEADGHHSQEDTSNLNGQISNKVDDESIKNTLTKHSKEFPDSDVCDKENEDCNAGARSTSVKKEAVLEAPHDKNEPKTEDQQEIDSISEKQPAGKGKEFENVLQENEEITEGAEQGEDSSNKDEERTRTSNTESTVTETGKDIVDETSDNPHTFNNELVKNTSTSESNSTIYQWLKFILDPFIEEFKDGIYPKLSDKTNNTLSNVSVITENATVETEKVNVTVTEPVNVTVSNTTDSGKKVKFQCTGKNVTDNVNATVKLITTAQLLQLLNFDKNDTENVTDCLLVMFYAPWCHFCAKVAPHYNALARAFPQLDFVAVDTAQFSNLLARFGTVSVPNILVFHQSRAAVKFNQTERTFVNFVTFVTNATGLEANSTVNVTDADYLGPVPSVPTDEPDYLLLISWIFVIFCSSCMFIKSNKGQQWINRVRILWQEHQHID
ncbi:thioredoxin domain-containing protein 15-like [Mercenaria mercenaria]|uniref:thioredoxin domain-containing protein 15-like n=1 Tax=Mercenaria mercenaria TaxID=6596 RepID=UPI001E1D4AAA|nr:thioredoxin domain-containing protein 15-like [Mercenaria mercenaria]